MKKTAIILFLAVFICSGAVRAAAIRDNIIIKKSNGGKMSFQLKDADIRTVLQIFGKQLGVNIVAGDEIKGKVSMSFNQVDSMEGLDAILRVQGYNWVREGNTIVVTTGKTVKTYTLQFANAKEVEGSIKPLIGADDSISINESYNQIIVKTSSDRIGGITKAVEQIDMPQTQVVVEAHIVEIKLTDGGTIGTNLKGTRSGDPNDYIRTHGFSNASTDTGLYAQVISNNYEAYLSAVLQEQNYKIVAAPRLTTINHKEAYILIGEKLGYQTSTTTTTGTTTSIKFLETGTKLVLTPHVSENGYIRMMIQPKISEGSVTAGIPNENTTETQNEVIVKDGQTIVIGGLIKRKDTQTELGIPILMHIPFLGMLFKRNVTQSEDRELIIFIKPSIITPDYLKNMQGDIDKFLDKTRKQKAKLIN